MTTTPHPFDAAKIEQGDPPPIHSGTPNPLAPAPDPAPEPEEQKPTAAEVIDTLTGYDELAIEKAFGADVETLARDGKWLRYLRAVAFGQELHKGATAADAYKTVLTLTQGELGDRFRDEDPDEDPDLPGSETGKD